MRGAIRIVLGSALFVWLGCERDVVAPRPEAVDGLSFAKPGPPPPPADPAIAFVNTSNGDKLMVMNADGSNQTILVQATCAKFTPSCLTSPSWSPDGASVVFKGTVGALSGVLIVDVAVVGGVPTGSNVRQVPIGLPPGSSPSPPVWSPLGDLLALAATGSGTTYNRDLYLVPPTGGTATLVHTSGACCYPSLPDWSPDGSKLVFKDNEISAPYRVALVILDLATSQVDTILPLNGSFGVTGSVRFPAWSRDGTRIAFTGYQAGETTDGIHTVAATAFATPVRLADGAGPTWSPNDSKLAFIGSAARVRGGVLALTLATGTVQALANSGWMPDWRRF